LVTYRPEEGKWSILTHSDGLGEARKRFDEPGFKAAKRALKEFLCDYFSIGDCNQKLGKTISPMGATPGGGKVLKVRFGLPGGGKSGGLRLAVVAYCRERRVVIAEAFLRKDDPEDTTFFAAIEGLD